MKIPASKYTKEKQAFLKSFTQDLRRLKRYEFCIDVTAGPGIYAGIRGSPIVLSESLPGTKMLFIEKNAEAFLSLNKHIVGHISKPNRVSTFLGDYNWVLPRIMTGLWDVPGIIYVDPCGYLDFSGIKNLCKSSSYKNMDILINFSTAHSSRGFRSYPSLSECIKKLDRKNAFATPSTGGWTKVFLTNSCGKDIMDLLRQHDMYDFRKESAKKLNVERKDPIMVEAGKKAWKTRNESKKIIAEAKRMVKTMPVSRVAFRLGVSRAFLDNNLSA